MTPALQKIWCDEDEHYRFEHFADFNEWLDSEEGQARGGRIQKYADWKDEACANFLPASADISTKGGALCASPQQQEANHGNLFH